MEKWKKVKSTANGEVSSLGRFRVLTRDGYTAPKVSTMPATGHKYVTVSKKALYLHKIVAEAFVENPNEWRFVKWINGDVSDNRAQNLEWKGSAKRPFDIFKKRGRNQKIIAEYKKGVRVTDLAKEYGLSPSGICKILRRA